MSFLAVSFEAEQRDMVFKYAYAWFGMMVLAIINGSVRDFVYKPHVGDLTAHQISTVVLIVLLAGYILLLTSIWPIKSAKQAWLIGGMWFLMTEAFESGMGLIAGYPRDTLLHTYNIFAGQVWIFIPLWVLVGPYLFFRFVQRKKSA
jgi:hypothetical protein